MELQNLFRGDSSLSKRFLANIRTFNNAFAFASFGTSTKYRDMRQPRGRGPNTFQVKGQLYHKIGGIVPPNGQQPQFAQIYFYDSDLDAEVDRRLDFIYGPRNQDLRNGEVGQQARDKDKRIIRILHRLMYRHNPYAKRFKTIGQRIRADDAPILGLKIVCQRAGDARRYNRPTADEVAAILPGDTTDAPGNRDIIIQLHNNHLYQVSALHQAYFPLCYPLLFLHGEDGYHLGLTRNDPQPPEQEDVLQHVLDPQFAYQHPVPPYDPQPQPLLDQADANEMDLDDANERNPGGNDNDSDIDDIEYDLEEQIDQGYNEEILSNHLNGADPQAGMEMDLDNDETVELDEGEDNQEQDHGNNRRRITMMDFFAYRLQYRVGDSSEYMFRSKRLLQQLMVDMFCTMDMNRLNYLKNNQQTLRIELYSGNQGRKSHF
jgi:hypothetical protein